MADQTIIDRLREMHAAACDEITALRADVERAHAARDAAERQSHEDTARYMQHMGRADAAERQVRDLRHQLATALRERDEARAALTKNPSGDRP